MAKTQNFTRAGCCPHGVQMVKQRSATESELCYSATVSATEAATCYATQDARQVAMVRNAAVRLQCDVQTDRDWLSAGGAKQATSADFCDSGGAADLALRLFFPTMQAWADTLKVRPNWQFGHPK